MSKRCADCNAWEIDLNKKDYGICKARAPHPTVEVIKAEVEYQIIWPLTGKDDWCRDFQESQVEAQQDA